MNHIDQTLHAEGQVRVLMDFMTVAIRGKNLEQVMSFYAPDVEAFDLLPPLRYRGADAVRERLSTWFDGFQSNLEFELHDLTVAADEGVAFCHCLAGMRGTTKEGGHIDMWWRATYCFRKLGGAWQITHTHSSEPFDMNSGQALLNLMPTDRTSTQKI